MDPCPAKRLLESSLEEELETYLRATWYQRSPERQDYRNETYTRDLTTELGLLRTLRVPRARTAGFQPQVNRLLCTAFISEVSTRQVGPLTALLLEDAVSASTVSRVTQSLDAEVRRFHARPLQDRYGYLLLDGITLKVKTPTGCRKRLVLCAYGLTPQGQRKLLSFRQVRAESKATWTAFLTDLFQRGLVGAAFHLIVTDGQPGLLAALACVYPFVRRQRCWAHKLHNVAATLPRRLPARWRVWSATSMSCSRSSPIPPRIGGRSGRRTPSSARFGRSVAALRGFCRPVVVDHSEFR